jgi:hypothetical protein
MPVSLLCPASHARFSVAESILGESVQCSNCGKAFTAVAPDAISPGGMSAGYPKEAPPHYSPGSGVGPSGDDRDLDIRRGGDSGSWRKTTAGLILSLICTIAALVIWWLIGLLFLLGEISRDWGYGILIVGLVVFATPLLVLAIFIGACLCCTAPYPPANKRAGIVAFLLACPLVVTVLTFMRIIPISLEGLLFLCLALAPVIGSMVFWFLFHVAVADFFQDASLRKFSILTMILTLANLFFFALLVMFHKTQFDDWFRRILEVVMTWLYLLPILVCNTIVLGMNSVLCLKALRTIKQETDASA